MNDFFGSVHTWLPIISKQRMTRNMINPMWEAGSDLALLFLCMKLMITRPQDNLESYQHPIYLAAKRLVALQEAYGMTSIIVLQSMILVAAYEIGQAIYPAAYMSVAACVAYAQVLGITRHEKIPDLLGNPVISTLHTFYGPILI
jgi:hypothetical protein